MKVLVTGSSGFIGKRLAKALEQKGHNVFGFDRSKGGDILNFEQVKRVLIGMDAVFHLAASLKEDDRLLFEINVNGTKNVLEASAKQQLKHFIFLSTVGVMGDIKGIADEKTPLNPQTLYEKSKAKAEELVLTYQEVLPLTVVRSALVIGPNKEWKQIVKMIEENFPLIGGGKNFWQTVFVDDLVDGLVFLLDKEDAIGETFIVAEENPKTLRKLVELIRKELGIVREIKTIPSWLGTVLSYFPIFPLLKPEYVKRLLRLRHYSTEKIKSLGWQAKYSTEHAVKETVKGVKDGSQL